jgi:hypothetical protein
LQRPELSSPRSRRRATTPMRWPTSQTERPATTSAAIH